METTIQNVLIDLKIVSMVGPNGKLKLINGVLALDTNSYFSSIRRFLSNTNRYSISYRIQQRILDLERLFEEEHVKDDWIKSEILKMIEPLKTGLMNLKETYTTDSQMSANFDIMVARVNNLSNLYIKSSVN